MIAGGRRRFRPAPTGCSSRRTWAGASARPTPAMRGAWVGFSWGHSQAHFCRAILESIAFEYAYYLGILRELIPGPCAWSRRG